MKQEEIEKSLRLIEGIYSIDEATSILRNELRINVEHYTDYGFYGWTFYPENKVRFLRRLVGNMPSWVALTTNNKGSS
jgi:hypothetical protein